MNQNSRSLIGYSAVDMISAAYDPSVNNFGIDSIEQRMGSTFKAGQGISSTTENQSFLPPVNELTKKNISHVSRSRSLCAQVFPRVWRQ
tara:strand:- start:9 stop:275 length:267 start_codon:yes stop_codon:yes gene_type:complete